MPAQPPASTTNTNTSNTNTNATGDTNTTTNTNTNATGNNNSGESTPHSLKCFEWATVLESTGNLNPSDIVYTGSVATVYKGKLKGQPTAFKVLRINRSAASFGLDHNDIQALFSSEVDTASALRHGNIVPLIGFSINEDASELALIFPYMALGDLARYLREHGRDGGFPRHWRLAVLTDAVRGLVYLHNLGHDGRASIVHRDVRSANVGLDLCGDFATGRRMIGRLLDMGTAAELDAAESDLKVFSVFTGDRAVFTPGYNPPELATRTYGLRTVGCVCVVRWFCVEDVGGVGMQCASFVFVCGTL